MDPQVLTVRTGVVFNFVHLCFRATFQRIVFHYIFFLNPQAQKQSILDKYGGSEYLETPDARLLVGQTESYVEYDRTGRIVKGAPKVVKRFISVLLVIIQVDT